MRSVRTFILVCRAARNETGAVLAELAIILPFLIIMVAAVSELGRFFQTYSTLCKSTRASSRYLSKVAYEEPYLTTAKNLAFCGKANCDGAAPVVSGLELDDIVLTPVYAVAGGNPETVMVSINGYTFTPIFDVGALLNNDTFSLQLPVRPSTTMYYMWTDTAGAGA